MINLEISFNRNDLVILQNEIDHKVDHFAVHLLFSFQVGQLNKSV